MRALPAIVRTASVLAAVAASFAAAACTTEPTPLQITASTPLPSDTAVPGDVAISVTVAAREVGDMPPDLELHTLAGVPVAGTATHELDASGATVYHFTPAAPLAEGSFALAFAGNEHYEIDDTQDFLPGALRSGYGPVAGHRPIVELSTDPHPRMRIVYWEGGAEMRASFSSDMDVDSLASVDVVDAEGNVVQLARTWIGGPFHELSFALDPTIDGRGLQLRLGEGVVSAEGSPMDGLPRVYTTGAIPAFAP